MRIDSSGNVGIGNTDPGALLQVANSSDSGVVRIGGNNNGATGLDINYSNSASTSTTIKQNYRATNGNALLKIDTGIFTVSTGTAGTERMRIDSSGRVGIGTSSPTVSNGNGLHIAGGNAGIKLQNTNNGDWAYVEYADESNTTKFIQGYRDQSGVYAIRPGTSLNATPGLSLDSSGNIGIGVSPSTKLHVGGSTPTLRVSHGTSQIVELKADTGASILRTTTNHPLLFGTADTERMRIDSSGNVFIGGTSDANADFVFDRGSRASFYRTLYIGGVDSAAAKIVLNPNGSATFGGQMFINCPNSTALRIRQASDGANKIVLQNDGTATFAADASINSLTVGRGGGNVNGNTAIGLLALDANTSGSSNTGVGAQALDANTTGSENAAFGTGSLQQSTTGSYNTAIGRSALFSNTTGTGNVANGYYALYLNTTASYNVANGYEALRRNTTGSNNVANGASALYYNNTGTGNVAVGEDAARGNSSGSYNTCIGQNALRDLSTGSGNIGIGTTKSDGANDPVFNVTSNNNRLVLGHTAISNAYVRVSWTITSDERDKMNFAPVPYGLDFVNQLKPTAYQFKVDRDTETPNGDVRYGFKAQDILALEGENPVIIDTEDADHLKYKGEHLVPVLVNAVQELTAMVKELQAEIKTLKG
jgi:hypothetical protein